MKHLMVVLGLVFAAISFQASAATLELGTITSSKGFNNTVDGSFTDTYTFTAPANNGIGTSITNVGMVFQTQIFGMISNFAATLDGLALSVQTTTSVVNGLSVVTNLLFGSIPGSSAGSHTLVVTGIGTGSYGGNITVVAQTPIPAAVWLFGSALAGLLSAKRRKAA